MIPQANESFWQKLDALDFLESQQLQQWKDYADTPDANWAELCNRIVANSVLRPAHLNQLASPNGQRVVWGSYLLLRPAYHPLGWQTYQAFHAKLHKEFRLIFLPGKEIQFSAGTKQQKVDLLERARKVAAISSNDIVKVIDIELFDDVIVAVTQLPVGQRLTELWAQDEHQTPWLSDQQWIDCMISLSSELNLIHQAGIAYGGIDPLTVQVDPARNRCRLDYLISNPVLAAAESVPMELSPEEQAIVVQFRSLRQTGARENNSSVSLEFDWQTLGSLFRLSAEKWQASNAEFSNEILKIASDLENGGFQNYNLLNNRLEALKKLVANDNPPVKENAVDADLASVQKMNSPPARPKKKTHGTLSSRREANNQLEKRRKLITTAAIVAPIPFVIVGFLIYYFVWIADAPLPTQLTDKSPVGDLPDFGGSTSESNESTLSDSESDSDEDEDKLVKPLVTNNTAEPSVETPKEQLNTPDDDPLDELAETLLDGNEEAAKLLDAGQASGDETTAEIINNGSRSTSELPEFGNTDGESTSEDSTSDSTEAMPAESDSTAVTSDKSSNTEVAPEETGGTTTFTFEGLESLVDVSTSFDERLKEQATSGEANQPVVYSLGKFNPTTARLSAVQWISSGDDGLSLKEIDKQEFVRQWKISKGEEEVQLARLRATTEGQLELAVYPEAETELGALVFSKLQLSYEADETMGTSIRFFEPKKSAKLEFASKGMIRPVNWETPELNGRPPLLRLSMSGNELKELPEDSSYNESLNLKRGETLYYLGDTFQPGILTLVGRLSPGKKTKFQGQLMLLTNSGLIKFDEPDKAAAISEQVNLQKQQLQARYDQIKSVRAKPGQGAAKSRQLDEIEALQKAGDAFLKSMEFLLEKGEGLYNGGVDFELRMGTEESSVILVESAAADELQETQLQDSEIMDSLPGIDELP